MNHLFTFPVNQHSYDMLELSKTNKCSTYARCSTSMQEQSIDSQMSFNRDFAAHYGLEIVQKYSDEGCSGRNGDRPGLKALLTDLKDPNRTWDLVLTFRLDRIYRNARAFITFQYELQDYGVYLLTAQEHMLNRTDPMTEVFRFFTAHLAEGESIRIGESIARGKMTAAQKGIWQGGTPPLGYDIVDGSLLINEREKPIIERIFSLRAENWSMQKIADDLNASGYMTKRNGIFRPSSIREIITNPKYMGDGQYNRSSGKGKNGKYNRHSIKPPNEIVRHKCPAIISQDIFYKVQPKTEGKQRKKKSTRYLLSGKVVCGNCNSIMHANKRSRNGKDYINFYCPKEKGKNKQCITKAIDMHKLELAVLNCIALGQYRTMA